MSDPILELTVDREGDRYEVRFAARSRPEKALDIDATVSVETLPDAMSVARDLFESFDYGLEVNFWDQQEKERDNDPPPTRHQEETDRNEPEPPGEL